MVLSVQRRVGLLPSANRKVEQGREKQRSLGTCWFHARPMGGRICTLLRGSQLLGGPGRVAGRWDCGVHRAVSPHRDWRHLRSAMCLSQIQLLRGQGSQAAPLLVLGGGGTPLFIWGEAPGFALCTVRLILLSDPKR